MSDLDIPQLSVEATRELTIALGARYWDVADPVTLMADGSLHIADAVRDDMHAHLRRRFEEFYTQHVPWIETFQRLKGARVLEIGAGTGSWTVALCLRGATVDGIDIDPLALEIAQKRCDLYGIRAVGFLNMNATEIDQLAHLYDVVLFCASFEHMTHAERKVSLRKAWDKLKPGGLIGILECPNRLWYGDRHTTFRNFFNWLPDDLAIDYAQFYDRSGFAETFAKAPSHDAAVLELARWGRGASYHDFEIVLGPVKQLNVKRGLDDHLRQTSPDYETWWNTSDEARYRNLLMGFEPDVPGAFFYPWLQVLIEKPSA